MRRDGGLDDPKINKDYLEKATKNVDRLASIVEDLLQISQYESGKLVLDIERFDIHQLTQDIFDALSYQAKSKQINLSSKSESNIPFYVEADKVRISQVLNNLISNAVKYGREKGNVFVGFSITENTVLTEISESREGEGGQPNFGVNLQSGYWKCLRCGASGGSLKSLQKKLGQEWKPSVSATPPTRPKRPPTQVQLLDEAVSEARSVVQRSPAWDYLAERGVTPYTALVYGLGYGIPAPRVHREIIDAARQSMMVRRDGIWLWAGGVVYADPPTHPAVMNVRYIPEEQLPKGTRNFTPLKNHKTWGNRVQPLGSCASLPPRAR